MCPEELGQFLLLEASLPCLLVSQTLERAFQLRVSSPSSDDMCAFQNTSTDGGLTQRVRLLLSHRNVTSRRRPTRARVYPCPHCGWIKPATGPAVIGFNDESGDSELTVLIARWPSSHRPSRRISLTASCISAPNAWRSWNSLVSLAKDVFLISMPLVMYLVNCSGSETGSSEPAAERTTPEFRVRGSGSDSVALDAGLAPSDR